VNGLPGSVNYLFFPIATGGVSVPLNMPATQLLSIAAECLRWIESSQEARASGRATFLVEQEGICVKFGAQ
jgi:hypothetical protein